MQLPSKGGRIADPVHGYVNFTRLERVIFQQKVAQRLRYICQNGLAYLIFPEAKSSRFAHSLGAMHLLSGALSSSFRNTDGAVRQALLNGLSAAVKKVAGEVGNPDKAAGYLNESTLTASACVEQTFANPVVLIEQALRLAAFFHDLGHLPFSHDFESGLEIFWRNLPDSDDWKTKLDDLVQFQQGRAKIHERVGHSLSRLIFRSVFESWTGEGSEGIRIAFELAQKVLDCGHSIEPSPEQAALEWLHSLIDGEVDVDRCDYILRDGRNHGFEFVNYDLTRLLDNLCVAQEGSRFVSAIRPQGLSAVEGFILSRFLHYKNGIRHHKVAQTGAALQHAIELTLATKSADVSAFIEDLHTLATKDPTPTDGRKLLDRFAGFDDVWWIGLMRQLSATSPNEWLALVCWRADGPRSFWKRIEEFPFPVSAFNEALPERGDVDAQEAWTAALKDLRAQDTLVARHNFEPWKARDEDPHKEFCMLDNAGSLKPISALSPLVKALPKAWMEDVQVHAFHTSGSACSREMVVSRMKEALNLK